MMRRALFALAGALAVASGCRSEISLGTPEADADGGITAVPPRCPGVASRSVVAVSPESLGELRGLAISGDVLYALFATPTNDGVLTRVPTSGGAPSELARVGTDPAGLAVSPDGAYVFVAARGTSQVFRIDRSSGAATVVDATGAPSSIVADDAGGAFWSVPATDAVLRWDFVTPPPRVIATSPGATSLARSGSALTIVGRRAVRVFVPGVDTAPRQLAARCDDGVPALDGQQLYCVESESILRVDVVTGDATTLVAAQTGATNVVVGGGRVLWRVRPNDQQTLVMAFSLDGIGGPTVFESSGPGPLIMAKNGCDLYFSAGRSIVRRGL